MIVEIGGTVGDIEGLPFLEAIRQMRKDVGRDNVLYIHVTLLPHIGATGEVKTKPTQHSVMELRRVGITADVIVCRADHPISDEIREKVALFADVDLEAVIPMHTVETIYEVPLVLEEAGLGNYLVTRLGLEARKPAEVGFVGAVGARGRRALAPRCLWHRGAGRLWLPRSRGQDQRGRLCP